MSRHALVLVLGLSLCPALAAAQKASDTKAAANALFDEGKRMLAAGDLDHACSKFEASLQLLDQLGVRLNLADCHERQGHTATAWAEFREAASLAGKRGDPRAEFARKRADALAPRLAKLQISVTAASQLPGLEVRRDGVSVPADAFGSPLPVNPGSYAIEVSAPGHLAWSTHVEVTRPGEVVAIDVPRLAPEPARAVSAGPAARGDATVVAKPGSGDEPIGAAPADRSAQRRRHLLGLGVGAGGVAAVGVGIALGLEARSKWRSVGTHCSADHVCDPTGASINHDARLYGNIGTVVGSVGVAAVLTGAILYVTAPAARPVLEHAYLDVEGSSTVHIGFAAPF